MVVTVDLCRGPEVALAVAQRSAGGGGGRCRGPEVALAVAQRSMR